MLLSHLIDVEIKAPVPSNHIIFSLRITYLSSLSILLSFSVSVLGQHIPSCFLGGLGVKRSTYHILYKNRESAWTIICCKLSES